MRLGAEAVEHVFNPAIERVHQFRDCSPVILAGANGSVKIARSIEHQVSTRTLAFEHAESPAVWARAQLEDLEGCSAVKVAAPVENDTAEGHRSIATTGTSTKTVKDSFRPVAVGVRHHLKNRTGIMRATADRGSIKVAFCVES